MKVAVNSRLFRINRGGIPYYIKLLYEELKNDYPSDEYIFLQTDTKNTLGITRVPKSKLAKINYLFDLFWASYILQNEKGVEVFHGTGNNIPVFKKRETKYVVTIHDVAFLLYPQHNSWAFNFYYRWIVWLSIKRANAVIAVSQNTKNDLIHFYKIQPEKVKVVYLGINKAYLGYSKTERVIKGPYIFSITTHPKRKNTEGVLRALARADWFKDFTYVIAGVISEEQKAELLQLINNLKLKDHVRLFGYATESELVALYQHAELFIYPSFYEGFGLPVLEAMACGCPAITSNTSSLTELMPDTKWLVNPKNIDDIEATMKRLLNLSPADRKQLITMNREFAQNFTWQRAARETREVFGSTL